MKSTQDAFTTMAYRICSDLVIVVHSMLNPDEVGWRSYLSALSSLPGPVPLRILVLSLGGAPTHDQCERLLDTLAAITTTSARMRLALMSNRRQPDHVFDYLLTMVGNGQRCALNDIDGALSYLGVHNIVRATHNLRSLCRLLGFKSSALTPTTV